MKIKIINTDKKPAQAVVKTFEGDTILTTVPVASGEEIDLVIAEGTHVVVEASKQLGA